MASCSRPGGAPAQRRKHRCARAGSADGARAPRASSPHHRRPYGHRVTASRVSRLEDRWPVRPSTLCPTARGRSPVVIHLSSRRPRPAGGTEPHHPLPLLSIPDPSAPGGGGGSGLRNTTASGPSHRTHLSFLSCAASSSSCTSAVAGTPMHPHREGPRRRPIERGLNDGQNIRGLVAGKPNAPKRLMQRSDAFGVPAPSVHLQPTTVIGESGSSGGPRRRKEGGGTEGVCAPA